MADEDQPQILGFTKKEAEILIMAHQVIRPHQCATNGCTARASDLVRIGAYGDTETARAKFAALRARVMALPDLPGAPSQTQSTTTANATKEADEKNDEEDFKEPHPFLTINTGPAPAVTRRGPPIEHEPTPFLLSEEEKKEARIRALGREGAEKYEQLLFSQAKQG